jgi:hypothetical protein
MRSPRRFASSHRLGLAIATAMLVLLAGLGTASANWSAFQFGNLSLKVEGMVSPSALPRHQFAPTSFRARGRIATVDGSHPLANRETVLYIDRNIEADVYGLPVCREGQLEARTVKEARRVCGRAIVGTGMGTAEVAFPEQAPIPTKSPLTLFNGGARGDTTTLFIHAYTTVPTPTALVATMKFDNNIDAGRYGVRAILELPVIAGGSGSVTGFDIKAGRNYTYRGFKKSYILGQCPDGQLQVKGTTTFKDEVGDGEDQTISIKLTLPCTPKG